MPPEPRAGATEPRLHLVGNDEAACCPDEPGDLADVSLGKAIEALGREEWVEQPRGEAMATLAQGGDRLFHLGQSGGQNIHGVQSSVGTVQIGYWDRANSGTEPLVSPQAGGELGQGPCVAVVAEIRHHNAVGARVLGRDPQGEIIRLRPTVGEHHPVETGVECGEQALSVLDYAVMRGIPRLGHTSTTVRDNRGMSKIVDHAD